MVPQGLP